jgi:hypothetical protein
MRLLLAVCFFVSSGTAQQSAGTNDPWSPVRFLIGKWTGDVEGEPGKGKSEREYRFVMDGAYIEVRNKSTYPASAKNAKGEVHEDWGMISFDKGRKKLVLRQFHVERFVNQFVQEPVDGGVVRFYFRSDREHSAWLSRTGDIPCDRRRDFHGAL